MCVHAQSTTANDAATLDVERNRVILRARTTTTATTPAVFELDLALRWPVDLDQIGAQLHRGTGELTVTMCVDVARAFSMAAHAGGSGESEISATPEAVSV